MDTKAELIGAVDQNPYRIGKLSVETLIKISEGKSVEKEVLVSAKKGAIMNTKDGKLKRESIPLFL